MPSQFQLYGSQDNMVGTGAATSSAQKVNPSRQLKRANSNHSSQDHYYGVVKKSADPDSTMITNGVNTSLLSTGGGPQGTILNTSTSALPNQIYQSTSVNSSKDLSLIQ